MLYGTSSLNRYFDSKMHDGAPLDDWLDNESVRSKYGLYHTLRQVKRHIENQKRKAERRKIVSEVASSMHIDYSGGNERIVYCPQPSNKLIIVHMIITLIFVVAMIITLVVMVKKGLFVVEHVDRTVG